MFKSAVFLFSFTLLIVITSCKSKIDPYQFAWDMSVENHTGNPKDLYKQDGKLRGMSVFNWRRDLDEPLNQLIKNNVEWIAVIPFTYQENDRTREMRSPERPGEWGRRDSSYMEVISNAHNRGMHVMLKPHLWMREGWRSNITLETDEDWDMWFESYRKNLIHYAILADSLDVELLCIGAEFRTSILKQPHKWELVISEVKELYKGKLTYAANWDAEYAEIEFWDQMDYIGIQAYFPLTKNANPSLKEVKSGWDRHVKMLEKLSKKYDKPILFTEIGYRSDNTATIEPWVWGSALNDSISFPSNMTQNLAYEALFQELWDEKWFVGMFFWQWHNDTKENEERDAREFTPRYKPAENTMAKWYGKE